MSAVTGHGTPPSHLNIMARFPTSCCRLRVKACVQYGCSGFSSSAESVRTWSWTRRETLEQLNTWTKAQDMAPCRDAFEMVDMHSRDSYCLLHPMRSASRSKDVRSWSEFLPGKPSFDHRLNFQPVTKPVTDTFQTSSERLSNTFLPVPKLI